MEAKGERGVRLIITLAFPCSRWFVHNKYSRAMKVAAIVTKLEKRLKVPQGVMERIRLEEYITKDS